MQILLIHSCSDLFSYDSYGRSGCWIEGDYSKGDLDSYKRQYLDAFNKKRMSKISVVHMDIAEDGTVTVLENVQGTHPLKVRKEINPAAVAKRAARAGAKQAEFNPFAAVPTPTTNFWATIDEVVAA